MILSDSAERNGYTNDQVAEKYQTIFSGIDAANIKGSKITLSDDVKMQIISLRISYLSLLAWGNQRSELFRNHQI